MRELYGIAHLGCAAHEGPNRGWIKGRWIEKVGQRERCFYGLTAEGRRVLRQQRKTWKAYVHAVNEVMEKAVRDWTALVRARLSVPGLTPERESRIVRELAAQLKDVYRDAVARGSTDTEADDHACRQVRDRDRMAQDMWLADRAHARPRLDRLIEAIDTSANAM